MKGYCLVDGCRQPAMGFFCTDCWKRLPWDLKAGITSARKTGMRRPENAKKAKEYIEKLNRNQGELNATDSAGN